MSVLILVAILVWLACMVVVAARSFVVVRTGRFGVLERFGRYERELQPGFHVLLPFVDRAFVHDEVVEVQVDVIAITRRMARRSLAVRLSVRSTSPKLAVYAIADLPHAVRGLLAARLIHHLGDDDLDVPTVLSRSTGDMREDLLRWGVVVTALVPDEASTPRLPPPEERTVSVGGASGRPVAVRSQGF